MLVHFECKHPRNLDGIAMVMGFSDEKSVIFNWKQKCQNERRCIRTKSFWGCFADGERWSEWMNDCRQIDTCAETTVVSSTSSLLSWNVGIYFDGEIVQSFFMYIHFLARKIQIENGGLWFWRKESSVAANASRWIRCKMHLHKKALVQKRKNESTLWQRCHCENVMKWNFVTACQQNVTKDELTNKIPCNFYCFASSELKLISVFFCQARS